MCIQAHCDKSAARQGDQLSRPVQSSKLASPTRVGTQSNAARRQSHADISKSPTRHHAVGPWRDRYAPGFTSRGHSGRA
jgi:hypothetical protein